MKFEHIALNVPDSVGMADWYVRYLGMSIVRSSDDEPYGRFLADDSGRVVMEIYSNRNAPIPDYRQVHPLSLHRAFAVADADAERDRLMLAGAVAVDEIRPPDGSKIYMLRDPWGVPLQLCERANPFAL